MRGTFSTVMLLSLIIIVSISANGVKVVRAQRLVVPDDYATIQEAIDAASVGDTVFVRSGNYFEQVLIAKSISLIGEDSGTTSIEFFSNHIVTVQADSVNITGFDLHADAHVWVEDGVQHESGSMGGYCLFLDHSNNCNISGNVFSNNQCGIWLDHSNNSLLINNTIKENWWVAIFLEDHCCGNTVSENVISDLNQDGICVQSESENNTITKNQVSACREFGIALWSANNILANNEMTDNGLNFEIGNDYRNYNQIDTSNTVNGKPVYYIFNQTDSSVPKNAGYVFILNSTGVSVEDVSIERNGEGIALLGSTNCMISNCSITNCRYGILLASSGNNTLLNNTVTVFDKSCNGYETAGTSITVSSSPRNILEQNVVASNASVFSLGGTTLEDYVQEISDTNLFNGKLTKYFLNDTAEEITPQIYPNVGYFAIVNSSKVHIHDLINSQILLAYTQDSSVSNITVDQPGFSQCVYLTESHNVSISQSNFTGKNYCIMISRCDNITVSRNNLTGYFRGIQVTWTQNSTFCENRLDGVQMALYFHAATSNLINRNMILNSTRFYVAFSTSGSFSNNIVAGNTIAGNLKGLGVRGEGNIFYHNNFINNEEDVVDYGALNNTWENGYPLGGNYWDDYSGADMFQGPFQNETGSDNIGDTAYQINSNYADRYPLMGPWTDPGEEIALTLNENVSLVFSNVTSSGITTLNQTTEGPDPPSGFLVITDSPVYYLVETTLAYSGSIQINVKYDDSTIAHELESGLTLMHWNSTAEKWEDITVYVDVWNNVIHGTVQGLSTFAIFVGPVLVGDINADGFVDIFDAILISNSFNSTPSSPTWNSKADINADGTIDIFDAILLSNHYGQHSP